MSITYTIAAGDCLYSIGVDSGIPWQKIWNHPNNADLKNLRLNPNILLPGDVLFIPDPLLRTNRGATDQQHRFVLKSALAKLRLRVVKPDPEKIVKDDREVTYARDKDVVTSDPPAQLGVPQVAWSQCPYVLEIDGVKSEGQTDGDGRLEASIPPGAQVGTLTLAPGTDEENVVAVNLGFLDPSDTLIGFQQRLSNLGYPATNATSEEDGVLVQAIAAFQADYGLDISGMVDDRTREALVKAHGI
jgi:hypothetical protein